jgi:hypothetical protein
MEIGEFKTVARACFILHFSISISHYSFSPGFISWLVLFGLAGRSRKEND